jgi:hypothetical protein
MLAIRLLKMPAGRRGMVKGRSGRKFQASGKTADPNALVGSGEIFLRDGRVQQYSLLVLLGRFYRSKGTRSFHRASRGKISFEPGIGHIDEVDFAFAEYSPDCEWYSRV